MPRPLKARINPAALRHNLEVARRHAPHSKIMAVIKANGYGHGMLRAAAALDEVDGFAVLTLEEALVLREAGFRQPVLLLEGFFAADELPLISKHQLACVIHCTEQIEMLLKSGLNIGNIFLKLNTGMNRLGFAPDSFARALERLEQYPGSGSITLMTHFASADEEGGITSQLALFDSLTANIILPRSLANSAALLRYPQTHTDWVRAGIMLYGVSPFADQSAQELGLVPAMTLESEIIALQNLKPGGRVGYGGAFAAEKQMRIGIVACGYADGYPRHAPTGTPVLVAGQRTRTLGLVSMDMLCVDLTDISEAGIGAPVVLWGEGLPVEEVARAAGTVSYELLCARAERVPVMEEQ